MAGLITLFSTGIEWSEIDKVKTQFVCSKLDFCCSKRQTIT